MTKNVFCNQMQPMTQAPDVVRLLATCTLIICCYNGIFSFQIEKMQKTKIHQYQIPHKFHNAIQNKIEEWLEKGVIEKSANSQFSFPILGTPKKGPDGTKSQVRVCFDARYLNRFIKSYDYPLPLIREIFESVGKFDYFATVDLAEAFHQLPVDPSKRKYLTFTWNNRHFSFMKTPFGIKTVPAFIPRLMESIFADAADFCRIFIDVL